MIQPSSNAPAQVCPETLPGFKHIHRTWDRQNDRWAARILPGEYFVTRSDEIIEGGRGPLGHGPSTNT